MQSKLRTLLASFSAVAWGKIKCISALLCVLCAPALRSLMLLCVIVNSCRRNKTDWLEGVYQPRNGEIPPSDDRYRLQAMLGPINPEIHKFDRSGARSVRQLIEMWADPNARSCHARAHATDRFRSNFARRARR